MVETKGDDMRKNRWQIGVGLLVLAAIVAGTAQAARRPSATDESSLRVRISPVFQEVLAGVEGVADIYIHDADSIYSASVRLSYAPGVIEILDADPAAEGVQVAPGDIFAGKSWYAVENEVSGGELAYGVALSRDDPAGASGGVLLARIHFRALQPGDSALAFLEVVLGDKSGLSLPAQVIPGLVRVTAEASSTTTPTPTGTPGPTARTILYFDPSYSLHMPGESGGLAAQLVSWDAVAGIEVHLGYDADVLTIADADAGMAGVQIRPGGTFGGRSWVVTRNSVEPEDGYITYAAALDGAPTAGLNGGEVFSLDYDAVASGAGGFELIYVAITDSEGNPIAVETASARVVVGPLPPTPEGPPPTATPTLTPTEPPTIVAPTVPPQPTIPPEPTIGPKPTIGPLELIFPLVMKYHTS